jgi:hypothetical protein
VRAVQQYNTDTSSSSNTSLLQTPPRQQQQWHDNSSSSSHTHTCLSHTYFWGALVCVFGMMCLPTACNCCLVLAGDITGCMYMQRTFASNGSRLLEPVQICQADSEARYRRGLQIKHGSAGIPPRQIDFACNPYSAHYANRYTHTHTYLLPPPSIISHVNYLALPCNKAVKA